MKTARTPLWDNLKFLLILSVVVGHFAAEYTAGPFRSLFLFIYSFHMPLFFFVSGLFHTNKDVSKRVTSFLAMYVISKGIIFFLRFVLGQNPSFKLLTEDGLPWFMFAMAVFILVTYLLRDVDKRWLLVVSILTACFSGYDPSIGDFLVLSRILVFFPFYLAGTMVSRDRLEQLHDRMRGARRLIPLAILAAWALLCLFARNYVYPLRSLFTGRNPFNETFYPLGIFWRLLCYGITTVLSLCIILIVPTGQSMITTFGQRTLQVYLWHRVVLYILVYFDLHTILAVSKAGMLLWLLIAVVLTFVLSLKPFGYLTDWVMGRNRPSRGPSK